MTFEQLRVFLAVTEHLSFTRAGEKLYMSQPAVSQHVQGLERSLKTQLFERKGRRLELTQGGEILRDHAMRILHEAADAETALSELNLEVHGRLVVGSTETLGAYLLPGLIGEFHAKYPQVNLAVRLRDPAELQASLASGEIDVAVAEDGILPRHRDRIDGRIFREGEVVLALPPDHRLAGQAEVEPEDLLGLPLIVRSVTDPTRAFWTERLEARGIVVQDMRFAFEIDHTEALKRAVMAGLGAGFVSAFAIADEVAQGRIAQVRLAGVDLKRPLWVLSTRRQHRPRAVSAFFGSLERALGAEALQPVKA